MYKPSHTAAFIWMLAKGKFGRISEEWELFEWYYLNFTPLSKLDKWLAFSHVFKEHRRMLVIKCGTDQQWLVDALWETKVRCDEYHNLYGEKNKWDEHTSHLHCLLTELTLFRTENTVDYFDQSIEDKYALALIRGSFKPQTPTEFSKYSMEYIQEWSDKKDQVVYDEKFGWH